MPKALRFMTALLLCLLISGDVDRDTALAQPVTPGSSSSRPFDAVNIMFIIDQSGSMGGVGFGGHPMSGPATDPLELRFVGPQYGLSWLSDFHETAVLNPRPQINVATIAFGSFPRDLLDWVSLDTDQPNWQNKLQDYLFDISADRFGRTNLGDTDFLRAVERAREFFPPPNPTPNALNVVVILTDGAPCLQTDPRFWIIEDDGTILYNCFLDDPGRIDAMRDHLRAVNRYVQTQFPGDNYRLYVIGLDVQDEYWSRLENHWIDIVCPDPLRCTPGVDYAHVTSSLEIGIQMRRVLDDIIQQVAPNVSSYSSVAIPPGIFEVKPYQQLLRVEIYKPTLDPLSTLTFNSPLGVINSEQISGQDTPIELHRFTNPTPGEWMINIQDTSGQTHVAIETVAAGLEMDPFAEGEVFNVIPLMAEVVTAEGQPFSTTPQTDLYPLTVTANVYDARLVDRAQRPLIESIQLERDTSQPDYYRFKQDWLPKVDGRFEIRLTATYESQGVITTLVDDSTALNNILIAPSVVEWGGIQPVSQRADQEFVGQGRILNGNTGDPARNSSQIILRVNITEEDGTPYRILDLPNTASDPGGMRVEFQIDEAGRYFVQLEAGLVDDDGDFIRLGNMSIPQLLEVRPLRPLQLIFLQPTETRMDAQAFTLLPPTLVLKTPVTVMIGLVDESTGGWISVSDVTGGEMNVPRLRVTSDGETSDLTTELSETQPGIYLLQLDELGMGQFTFNASVDLPGQNLAGDYVWLSNSDVHNLSRQFAPSLAYLIAGILLAIVLAVLIVMVTLGRHRYLSYAPLKGTLMLMQQQAGTMDYIPIKTFNLDASPRNKRVFRKKQLASPFEKLIISTRRDLTASEKGDIYIEQVRINGKDVAIKQELLRPQRPIVVATSEDGEMEYLIAKDMDDLTTLAGGSDFIGALSSK